MRRVWVALCLAILLGLGGGAAAESAEISLTLIVREGTQFTNVLSHYVTFDAQVRNAEKLTIHVYDPEGNQTAFKTRKHVENDIEPSRAAGYMLKAGQESYEGLNVYFPIDATPGTWTVEVTATAEKKEPALQTISVEVQAARTLWLGKLAEVRAMLVGAETSEPQGATLGKIRFVTQDPEDRRFVKEYWLSGAYDLRSTAKQKCTRAIFSMALSWFGVDITPVGMSDLLRNKELYYTYDQVCDKLGDVERLTGDLETLWGNYMAGEASPVLLHFKYTGGMHAVLLVARDDEDPELFYGITPGQRVDTSPWPDGQWRDAIIPILIEKGEVGQRIQSPLLERYHRGVIDQIWQWRMTDEH